jgi:hypothetical protein
MGLARALSVMFIVGISATACARGPQAGRGCKWPPEDAVAIDPNDQGQQRHLRTDAEAAAALAVRYADRQDDLELGTRRHVTEQCEAALFESIARIHHVSPEQVRQALRRQNDSPF